MALTLVFIPVLISGTLISISATSWVVAWMGLEINLMAFIPLMSSPTNQLSNESMLKYFLTQAFASSILMLGILSSMFLVLESSTLLISGKTLIMMALTLKLGAAPFHFWFPTVMSGLSWMNCFLLMTWQKLAPLFLLISANSSYIMAATVLSAIVGALGGFNQTLLRKILAYSSINHLGWMLFSSLISKTLFLTYFWVYSVLTMTMTVMFASWNINSLAQTPSFSSSMPLSSAFSTNLLSLGGLPPFLGFLPKWMVIQAAVFIMPAPTLLLILMSLLTLFYYLRVTYNTFLKSQSMSPLVSPSFNTSPALLTTLSATGLMVILPLM
uniref:NADH-ubiquinone oxidoreductase chain 2 n=1 Tax=Cermatobius longicornis TaxID=1273176 RepID=R4IRY4_9MYRI|nr:NADH dehydrogenase subunit 2 [Cermatobius longicornis]AGA84612.1 NADH dehydrogenase subunit 2 [Cermatobius longicornis]